MYYFEHALSNRMHTVTNVFPIKPWFKTSFTVHVHVEINLFEVWIFRMWSFNNHISEKLQGLRKDAC